MALSNPPAVREPDENSPLAGIDERVIRLSIDGVAYGVPLRDIAALLDKHLPAFVIGDGSLTMKEQTLRSSVKALLPMGLRLLESDIKKFSAELQAVGGPSLPLPDLKARHRDLIDYTVHYLAALILVLLSASPWEAHLGETVDGPGGYIRLSGLSGGVASRPDGSPAPDTSGSDPDAA